MAPRAEHSSPGWAPCAAHSVRLGTAVLSCCCGVRAGLGASGWRLWSFRPFPSAAGGLAAPCGSWEVQAQQLGLPQPLPAPHSRLWTMRAHGLLPQLSGVGSPVTMSRLAGAAPPLEIEEWLGRALPLVHGASELGAGWTRGAPAGCPVPAAPNEM